MIERRGREQDEKMRPGADVFEDDSLKAPAGDALNNYSSCHDVAKLYSVRLHSGDVAHIRDTAPVICRGFVIFEVRHARMPQRRAPPRPALTAPAAVPAPPVAPVIGFEFFVTMP